MKNIVFNESRIGRQYGDQKLYREYRDQKFLIVMEICVGRVAT